MIKTLLNWFGPKAVDTIKSCPEIQGHFTVQMLDSSGKVRRQSEGYNIWTLTGREYLSELISLQTFSAIEADRVLYRNDRIAYIGLGTGSQPEVAAVSSLVYPVGYDTGVQSGNFLAVLDPAQFPATSSATTKTSVRFSREFTSAEYSIITSSNPTGAIVLTEAGLFTDGDPTNDFAVGTISTALADSSGFAPVAYKTFEPITKTPDFTMKVIWEVRFI